MPPSSEQIAAAALPLPSEAPAPGESGFFSNGERLAEPLVQALDEVTASFDPNDVWPDVVELEPLENEDVSEWLAEAVGLEQAPVDAPHEPADGFVRVQTIVVDLAGQLAGAAGQERARQAFAGAVELPAPVTRAMADWRELLAGHEGAHAPDLTLDQWAAAFLAALFEQEPADLRGRVRSAGIAAFGVLDAA